MSDFGIEDQTLTSVVNMINNGSETSLIRIGRKIFVKSLTAGSGVTIRDLGDTIEIQATEDVPIKTTTTGAEIVTLVPILVANDTVTTIRLTITTGNVTDQKGSSHTITSAFRHQGSTLTQIDGIMSVDMKEYPMTSAGNISLDPIGSTIFVNVLGLTGKVINWTGRVSQTIASL